MTKDPTRLMDSASGSSSTLRHLLDAGRSELPTKDELASLESKLGPILNPPPEGGAGSAPEPGPAPAAVSGGLSAGVKAAIGAGLLAAGVGAVVVPSFLSESAVSSVPPVVSAPVLSPASVAPIVTSAQSRRVEVSARPSVGIVRPAPQRSSAPDVARDAKPALDPVAEARLLEEARHALASQPARALALCGEHARTFPGGLLSQEREVITIQALARVGRRAEAETRARRFAQAHPRSAHLRRLVHLLGDSGAADAG